VTSTGSPKQVAIDGIEQTSNGLVLTFRHAGE
jgi:hypothetical protein